MDIDAPHIIIPFVVVMIFVVLDYATGVINAALKKQVSSEKMRTGLARKFTYIIVLFVALVVEYAAQWLDMGFTLPVYIPVCVAIALIELTSVLENCTKINPSLTNSKVLDIFQSTLDKITTDDDAGTTVDTTDNANKPTGEAA